MINHIFTRLHSVGISVSNQFNAGGRPGDYPYCSRPLFCCDPADGVYGGQYLASDPGELCGITADDVDLSWFGTPQYQEAVGLKP